MKSLQKMYVPGAILMVALLIWLGGYAQTADGNAGINEANTLVKSYFAAATTLLYAVGAIMGLVGAIKVYSQFINHDQRTMNGVFIWVGGCIFLVVVASVIQSFFGV
jgi:Domain of unknown function (DUF4134)